MPQNQLAPANKARFHGIQDATITYTGRSATSRNLSGKMTLESSELEVMADVAEAKDREGEVENIRPTNDRLQFSFSFTPLGAAASDAEDLAEDLPKLKTLCTIACAANVQIATPTGGSTVIDSVKARYTDKHVILDFTVTHWFGKVFTQINS